MKILMVSSFLGQATGGGVETYVLQLGEHLTSIGHEVQYFGFVDRNRRVSNNAGVHASKVPYFGKILTPERVYTMSSRPFGRAIIRLASTLCTVYNPDARRKIRVVLDDFQPDACHLNHLGRNFTPSILLEIVKWRKDTGKQCKVVYTTHDFQLICPNHLLRNQNTHRVCEKCIHGNYFFCIKEKCRHGTRLDCAIAAFESFFWKARRVHRHIDRIICCSEFMKRKIDTNPALAGKTVVLTNFAGRHIVKRDTKKRGYVVYFGRISEEKGVRTLVEACRELPEIPFVFAGKGPLEDLLSDVPNIRNAGFQSGESLEKLVREASFSVCPSECHDICPFSVVESLMYGTPVLGSRMGGIPELVQEGETGLLFESGNKDELKRKIRELYSDSARLAEMSQNCAKITLPTIDEYGKRIVDIYNE